jgi:tRNA pseudouridine38-40 synthase
MHRIELRQEAEMIEILLEANAFLHHMCRNIVGSLLKVGRGDVPVSWLAELLLAKNRKLAGITAPAQGLCFLGPLYPAVHNLPERLTLREQVPDHRLKDSDATNPD